MNIAYDFDGVINNLSEVWVNYLNKKFHQNVDKEIKYYDMTLNFPNLTKEEILQPLNLAYFWKKVNLIPDSIKYINKLKELGHNIFIVTATDPEHWVIKYKYCFQRLLPDINYKNIILTHRKDLIKADILIDDNPEYLSKFSGLRILYETSYNKCSKEYYDIKVNNHEELYDKICFNMLNMI